MKKLELKQLIREVINENDQKLTPSSFEGAVIKGVIYLSTKKCWSIVTNKGTFNITKNQSFEVEE